MIGNVMVIVWLFGWCFGIYPTYRFSLRRETMRGKKLDGSDVGFAMIMATMLMAFWPLAVPFFLSRAMHGRVSKNFNVDNELAEAQEAGQREAREKHERELRAREIEVIAREVEDEMAALGRTRLGQEWHLG